MYSLHNNSVIITSSIPPESFNSSFIIQQNLSYNYTALVFSTTNRLQIGDDDDDDDDDDDPANFTACHETVSECLPGLLLPAWHPHLSEVNSSSVKAYRAIVYLLTLAYVLFGVNIITDRMVSCIEVIISQKRKVSVTLKNGETHSVHVPIWHPVVATLTVHVMGASAAEIFLPIIEMAKHHFVAHELGSSLIFGSGAYHLFMLIGLCLISVKETVSKPIQDLRVFFVTTSFAIFAYLWMFFLVDLVTPGEITLGEAIATVCFFPILVFTAWFVDRRFYRIIRLKIMRFTGVVVPAEGEDISEATSDVMREIERKRRISAFLKDLRAKHPEKSALELEGMAQVQLLESLPKDAAFYRMQAAKSISGGGEVISKDKIKKRLEHEQRLKDELERANAIDPNTQLVGFEQPQITVVESCGSAIAVVTRSGPGIDQTDLLVDYETVAGSANVGEDYEETKGTLEFDPGVTTSIVAVKIIDDDEFEENKSFTVRLNNPRLMLRPRNQKESAQPVLITQKETSINILDDDHCGVFQFETTIASFADNIGTAKVKVVRLTGARGRVLVPYKVTHGSAKEGHDFTVTSKQEVTFENDQAETFIQVSIIDRNRESDIFSFYIELLQPRVLSQPPQNPLGNPVLGETKKIQINICEDDTLVEIVDRLLLHGDIADLISSTTWLEQFKEAVDLSSLKREEKRTANSNQKTKLRKFLLHLDKGKNYTLYGLSLPWKVLAAVIPPASYLHGWLAFGCLLILMAFLSALIGDLATAFGCTVGLKDTVIAITLIAFGMGLPDTLASRHAAMHEHTADAAIGGITGSNAVNVFLGIGMSWLAASIYHSQQGTVFKLPNRNMGFIVVVYCGLATAAVITLMLRRLPPIRGELGGPPFFKYVSAALFLAFWITFVLLLALESYCIITGSEKL